MTADHKPHSELRYRTIVADPPWPMASTPNFAGGYAGDRRSEHRKGTGRSAMPYPLMGLEEIKALPVSEMAEVDAHLYLWTFNTFLRDAYEVAESWGFTPRQVLVWAKKPRGLGLGGTFTNTTEFVLFCRRGSLASLCRVDTTWWSWKRPYGPNGIIGSAKPEGFLDLVESVSPGPYLELFARRNRFGWDTWGNEALEHVELPA